MYEFSPADRSSHVKRSPGASSGVLEASCHLGFLVMTRVDHMALGYLLRISHEGNENA